MKTRKSVQKLMPNGIELTLQGESTGAVCVKVIIKKSFNSKMKLDEYLEKKESRIKRAMISMENVC